MIALRSALFFIGQVASAMVIAFLGLLVFPFSFGVRYAVISRWALFNLWWLEVTCGLTFEVRGAENVPGEPCLIFCKHQSAWETLALQAVFPPQVWLLKKELLMVPFFGWGLAMLEPIAIDRKAGRKALKQLLDQGKQRLDDGRFVVIFPEGTRVAPGEKGKYQPGGAMLAQHAAYPVVPVAHNAGVYWPKGGFLKRRGKITLSVGKKIDTEGLSAREINEKVEAWIETEMGNL